LYGCLPNATRPPLGNYHAAFHYPYQKSILWF